MLFQPHCKTRCSLALHHEGCLRDTAQASGFQLNNSRDERGIMLLQNNSEECSPLRGRNQYFQVFKIESLKATTQLLTIMATIDWTLIARHCSEHCALC